MVVETIHPVVIRSDFTNATPLSWTFVIAAALAIATKLLCDVGVA